MPTVVVHIHNEDPIVGEVDRLPEPTDNVIQVKNPRKRDGKDLHYLEANVNTVYWPMARISFIEVLPTTDEDDIISFVRE